MSGIEVAGIVLAVLPLCISALEHYEDEVRPVVALFDYRNQLAESVQFLHVVQSSFKDTVLQLCYNADIADSEHLDEMIAAVKSGESGAWSASDNEQKLVIYLGAAGHRSYKTMALRICGNLAKIAHIVGLDEKEMLKVDAMDGFQSRNAWAGVASAAIVQPTLKARGASLTKKTAHEMKKRLKYILYSGTIGSLLEKIVGDTEHLDRLIQKSSQTVVVTSRPAKSKTWRSAFTRPLTEIETYASRLHQALESVWSCSKHTSHCVNLRLDRRLHKADDKAETDGQAAFAIALKSSQAWHSLDIHLAEEPPASTTKRVGFHPSILKTPDAAVVANLAAVVDLCTAVEKIHSNAGCASFCLDHKARLLGDYPAPAPSSTDLAACRLVTLKELLGCSTRANTYSPKQGLLLSLTLVSSFLQLQSTPWLQERLNANDICLLRHSTKLDVERPFISQIYPVTTPSGPAPSCSDSEKILALGIMLFEICESTPFEDRRPPGTQGDKGIFEDALIVRSCLQSDGSQWFDCFAKSIKACLKFYWDNDLDLNDPTTREDVVNDVLLPFQQELRWFS